MQAGPIITRPVGEGRWPCAMGDFEAAGAKIRMALGTETIPYRPFRQPLWDGSLFAGRTILLHAEQGFGDTLQFVRYAPLVKERTAARSSWNASRPCCRY